MQRLHLPVAVVLTGLAGVAVLAVSAGGQAPPAASPADFTVTTTTRDRDGRFVDNPPRRKESAGDTFAFTGRSTGAKTGSLEVTCALASAEVSLCDASAAFSDGHIHLAARVAGEGKTIRGAIVGGTGAYSGAKGTVTATTVSERKGVEVARYAYDFVD